MKLMYQCNIHVYIINNKTRAWFTKTKNFKLRNTLFGLQILMKHKNATPDFKNEK